MSASSADVGGAPRPTRANVCFQPPSWAPNVDVELELSGAADPAEMLDFASAIKAVAFAHDGGCMAAGCQDGQVRTVRINTEERNLAGTVRTQHSPWVAAGKMDV